MKIKFLKLCRDVYSFLKKHIKSVIPKQLLFKNELFFRSFYGIFYQGKKHQCNICSKTLRAFIQLKNEDLLCPYCGSLSRNRRLLKFITENYDLKGNLLHFSPSRSLYRLFKKNKNINYFSSDFENEFLADYTFDITNISQPNETFDTIICYHVLEHVINDNKAMSELFRILKPQGHVFIQTPFKEGDIYENDLVVLPEDREQHFGQADHVRVYSVEGLKDRLEAVGFKITIKNFNSTEEDQYFGLKSPETLLIATK